MAKIKVVLDGRVLELEEERMDPLQRRLIQALRDHLGPVQALVEIRRYLPNQVWLWLDNDGTDIVRILDTGSTVHAAWFKQGKETSRKLFATSPNSLAQMLKPLVQADLPTTPPLGLQTVGGLMVVVSMVVSILIIANSGTSTTNGIVLFLLGVAFTLGALLVFSPSTAEYFKALKTD